MNTSTTNEIETEKPGRDANRDPLSGAPGAHPVGVGVGAAGAGAAGAAAGMAMGGPVGAVIGAAIGAVAGGYAGKGVAEAIDPTAEEAYWRDNHAKQAYVDRSLTYDDYEPAYRTGYTGYGTHGAAGRDFDSAEKDLQSYYDANRGNSQLGWDKAKAASRAAWDRVERALPGDADRDGK
jgi:uncharacterized protein YcfJ